LLLLPWWKCNIWLLILVSLCKTIILIMKSNICFYSWCLWCINSIVLLLLYRLLIPCQNWVDVITSQLLILLLRSLIRRYIRNCWLPTLIWLNFIILWSLRLTFPISHWCIKHWSLTLLLLITCSEEHCLLLNKCICLCQLLSQLLYFPLH
jgi:hypothetical protein